MPDPNRIGPLDKPRKFSRALFDRVVTKLIQEDHNTLDAIRSCGISTSLFYKELQTPQDLFAILKEAQVRRDSVRNTKRIEEAERELHRRAVEGWDEPVFDIKGNHCGDKRRYSDACLIFMLKKLKPEVFEDRPAALVQNNLAITAGDEKEIIAQWRQKLGAAP